MNKLIKILPLLATGVALVGCQDEDFGFDAKDIKYETEFRKAFGKIDPEQDWNLSTRATANVNLGEDATIKIYSESPLVTSAKLMANYEVKDSRTFEFDLPQGTKDVYVQAVSKRGAIVSGYYNVEDGMVNVNARQAGAATRATDPCPTTVGEEVTLHMFQRTSIGTGPNGTNEVIDTDYTMYTLNNVTSERATPWKMGDFKKVLATYTDANGQNKNGVFKEYANNWENWVRSGILTGDVKFTLAENGPVSVTLNYRCTSTYHNDFCYFFYTGDEYPSPEDIILYRLIDKATGNNDYVIKGGANLTGNADIWQGASDDTEVQGTTFDLVYIDDNGEASYEFPKGIHIGFAVVQDNVAKGFRTEGHATGTGNATDKVWFSIQSMNPLSSDFGFGTAYHNEKMPAAATFKMGDVTFLGFEDWPDETSDGGASDLNDLLFFAVGNFEEDIPDVDPDPVKYTQDWMLIYEDLGNSFDWDYNDVVLKVEHVSGETTAKITALAAGGTLSSHVFYNTTDLGEIHTWFGQAPAASGSNTVTNAESRGNKGATKTIEVDEDFSMTTLGQVADMGGIILKVKKAEETGFSEESTTIAYDLANKGTAPEVICLPASWTYTDEGGNYIRREFRWPAEIHNIDKAYPHFKDWAANKSLYPGWYAEDPVLSHCVTGTFEQQVSAPTDRIDLTKQPSGLALEGAIREITIEGNGTTVNYDLAVENTDYTTSSEGAISYQSSNPSLISVSIEEGQLVITRQTIASGVAYVRIYQAATDDYSDAMIDYIKVTLDEKPITTMVAGQTYELNFASSSENLESLWVYQSFWVDLSAYALPDGVTNATLKFTYSNAGNNIQLINKSKNSIKTFSGYNQSPHSEDVDVTTFFIGGGFYVGFGGTGMTLSKVEITISEN